MTSPVNPFQPGGTAAPRLGAPAPGIGTTPPATPGASDDALTVAKPPTVLLIAAGVLAAVGLVVAAITFGSWIAIIGWSLAGPLAIGVMGAFVRQDTDRRAEPVYVRPHWIAAAYAAVIVLTVAGILVGALGFAFWMGRQ